MTLPLKLPEDQEATLITRAQAQGLSAEEYAQQLIARELETERGEPFWKSFTRRMHSLSNEVFEQLPSDGAGEHYMVRLSETRSERLCRHILLDCTD